MLVFRRLSILMSQAILVSTSVEYFGPATVNEIDSDLPFVHFVAFARATHLTWPMAADDRGKYKQNA